MGETKERSKGQKLMDKLSYKSANAWEKIPDRENIFSYCEDYKAFLDVGKTERGCVKEIIKRAEKLGFEDMDKIISEKHTVTTGDKVYRNIRNKAVILAVVGKKPLEDGTRMIGSHIDAPRIDIKQNPLYENTDMAFLKTHYYGGIKKYQWLAIPLALHGVIIKKNGETVDICIGEDENDPVFTITDLLPHLAKDQMSKKLSEAFSAEAMNALLVLYPMMIKKLKTELNLTSLTFLMRSMILLKKISFHQSWSWYRHLKQKI